MQGILTLFMIVIVLQQTGVSRAAESTLIEKHQKWETRVIQDGNTVVFRAHTEYSPRNDYIVLTLDRHAQQCSSLRMKMNIVLPKVAENDFASNALFGAMRIDDYPVRHLNYVISADRGDRVAIAKVTNFDREESLFAEIIKGQAVRFQLSVGDESYYLRFSLLGSTAALNRTRDLCHRFAALRPDPGYLQWDTTIRGQSDRRY